MAVGSEDYKPRVITNATVSLETKVSVTDTAQTHTLQAETLAVEIYNDGTGTVYREIDSDATTNSRPIRARTSQTMDIKATSISLICASGGTASVWITELR